ncbi:hypothetical protein BDB00DRAFT_963026 [Zychaea mexicana]|uniref:uncharacterized protein n=1 Tax=Zychaea mexicana TaxID=64656 RepID=UPI0022FE7DFC|nr:uncharacterized protein BDB00DRAFT_963026 [Zychaea mexicana]KAI9488956.1 hypothetical protein BDB00DRAFT_963026 [Zychaea mexicana]
MPTDNTPSDNERSSSDKEAANMKLETVVQRFLEKCNELNENPSLWRFVEENTDFIAKNSDRNSAIEAKWAGIFGAAMKQRKIEVAKVNKKPDFGAVALKMLELARESSKDHSTSAVTATTKTPSHTSFSTSLSSADKARLAQTFQNLKEDRFWALHLDESLNVDQRVIEFARSCNYYHPSQSLILDLGDGNWETVFSGAQLDRIEAFGDPLFCDLPAEIIEILNEVSKLKTPMEAYKFARTLDFDPIKEPLKHWVSLELQKSSQLHFYGDFHLTSMLESDQQYEMWSFLKSMVNGNKIKAVGKEGSSKANADENNKKRCISAVDPAIHRKMGRKMDLLYESSGKELGCIEIGKDEDQTKEMKDGLLKMPIVMHDMLLQVAFSESLLRCVHVLGFVIVGMCIPQMSSSMKSNSETSPT